ncbi:MAG: phosphoadenylyl-sulfate reductase [Pseudohongiella sp.]|nr:phosphoadenylyl-sulfate reductase [Pseudohongiella sp.]
MTAQEILQLNASLLDSQPKDIMAAVIKEIPNFALSFSGAEDVVLIEMASKLQPSPPVFTLDTGRLHAETYQFMEQVRDHYSLTLETLHPNPESLKKLISNKGLYSFYTDGHEECCGIRKVEPLKQKLAGLDAWITGQRRDQSPTRADVPVIQIDKTFSTDSHQLIKVNPLANWSSADVWNYIRMFDVPFNPLHERGYISIGCEPCSRAVRPNQHEREGRWWWEESTQKECGLHIANLQDKSPE